MPELPEVETVRRRIAPALEGRRFETVEITDARLTRPHDPFEVARELEGERVAKVDRRGKYLIVRFAGCLHGCRATNDFYSRIKSRRKS